MRSQKDVESRLRELKHLWAVSDKGRKMFKSRRWKIKGEMKALEWVLSG